MPMLTFAAPGVFAPPSGLSFSGCHSSILIIIRIIHITIIIVIIADQQPYLRDVSTFMCSGNTLGDTAIPQARSKDPTQSDPFRAEDFVSNPT